MNSSLTLNNPARHISRVNQESKDFSLFDHGRTLARMKVDLESSSLSTTQQNTSAQQKEKIINEKEPFIKERNKILNNPIKYLFYRKKLRAIDTKLDSLELQIYILETEDTIKESDLNKIISTAEARLEKYSKQHNQQMV